MELSGEVFSEARRAAEPSWFVAIHKGEHVGTGRGVKRELVDGERPARAKATWLPGTPAAEKFRGDVLLWMEAKAPTTRLCHANWRSGMRVLISPLTALVTVVKCE